MVTVGIHVGCCYGNHVWMLLIVEELEVGATPSLEKMCKDVISKNSLVNYNN